MSEASRGRRRFRGRRRASRWRVWRFALCGGYARLVLAVRWTGRFLRRIVGCGVGRCGPRGAKALVIDAESVEVTSAPDPEFVIQKR